MNQHLAFARNTLDISDVSIIKTDTGKTIYSDIDLTIADTDISFYYLKDRKNLDMFCLFTSKEVKTNEVLTYHFNEKETLTVNGIAGSVIPGEEEEKIFIYIVKKLLSFKERERPPRLILDLKELKRVFPNLTEKEIDKKLQKIFFASYKYQNKVFTKKESLKIESYSKLFMRHKEFLNKENRKAIKKIFEDRQVQEFYIIDMDSSYFNKLKETYFLCNDFSSFENITQIKIYTLLLMYKKYAVNNILKIDMDFMLKALNFPLETSKDITGSTLDLYENLFTLRDNNVIKEIEISKDYKNNVFEIEFKKDGN